MDTRIRNALLAGCAILVATTVARAQSPNPAGDPIGDLLGGAPLPAAPQPYTAIRPSGGPVSASDQTLLAQGLAAARRSDTAGARNAIAGLSNPVARQIVTWALVDTSANMLGFAELDAARRDLADFPRAGRRQIAAERVLETSGKSPAEVVAWFEGLPPESPQGAMALASALRSLGRGAEAQTLIRSWWRDRSFEADVQRTLLTRFGDMLGPDDHARRADILLYGAQGPAARDMIALLPPDRQTMAQVRIALRGDSEAGYGALSAADQRSPGVAFERVGFLRRKGREAEAIAQLAHAPREVATAEQASRTWKGDRYRLTLSSIRAGDWRSAYAAAANTGLTQGADAAEAEFYAGWIALTRLKDPTSAARHFAAIERIGSSPITRSRALYWQGRAAEGRGDATAADNFYALAAEHPTAFYGQLAAEKLRLPITLPKDPTPTAAERARFESRPAVKAMRLLAEQNQMDLFRVFALHLDDTLPDRAEGALLVDAIRGYGDQDTSMKAVRALATRNLVLIDRGYPVRATPEVPGAPEPALILGITRQESGFDPKVRSHADARGMMQLLPSTAATVARRMGVGYSAAMLYEPDYNMRLGTSFLGQLVNQFSGSYIMAAAGYNAGPGRPPQWAGFCGDPRAGSNDPIDFIECIPFYETRNYVMRVMENMVVYRAKQNGGTLPATLSADLRRGGYGYAVAQQSTPAAP
ncbi:lytic transglycosylase domain-containing protein [Phenylobacterium sp. SCN 70-31]|uniref:lytic transglycosylase domain-containing protein n=1 Tax=Phenylobacterium sp. SCN 70-31 TaxID=1660129 RepID=UPI000B28D660|nr:lytic transglycosylase domain-containing protein [Phenylobacterium sp. SCN 70-31]